MNNRRQHFVSCPVDTVTRAELLNEIEKNIIQNGQCKVIQFANANKVVIASEDYLMKRYLDDADYVLADGMPLIPLSSLFGFRIPERLEGVGLMQQLIKIAAIKGYRIFLLGATERIVHTAVQNLIKEYPNLNVVGYRNGYFKEDQIPEIVNEINSKKPNIIFLGFPSPLKEKFAFENRKKINANIIQGVGGSFDVIAGLVNRAPTWMQKMCLEWLYRVIKEPRRLFIRYLSGNYKFIILVFRHLFNRITTVNKN